MNAKNVLKKAIETYGEPNQVWMAIEEMAELTNALAKFRRGRSDKADVITEIADVRIMIDQLALIFGEEEVKEEELNKLARLHDRMKAEEW